ncbi:hypothetical protein GMI70_07085 [Eggerthellaceae bacterium zg-893]|nr:hypothetical protein [Eggerthellaceae bacterium zg-893]
MSDIPNDIPPRHAAVGHAYGQALALGVDWRFPCNPDMDDLCERGELAGAVPVVTFLPADQALAVFERRASLVFAPLPPYATDSGAARS